MGVGFCPRFDSEQRLEGGVAGPAPVEAQDELVEVALLGAQAVAARRLMVRCRGLSGRNGDLA